VPPEIHVSPGTERRVRAVALDAAGRRAQHAEIAFALEDASGAFELRGAGSRPAVYAGAEAPVGSQALLRATASAGALNASAHARVLVAEPRTDDAAALGIPEPALVSAPHASWRSRMLGARWEINDAHEDYLALRKDPRARLRYLLSLLAKELAQRAHGFEHVAALDALVEVLAHAERNLRGV
jgi:hypothetical protein